MSATEPRPVKAESLEAKFKLLSLLPYDKRAKRKHCLVFGFILDWYHSRFGNALASVRHVTATIKERDPDGVGLYAGDVHAALTDLVSWGWLEQEKGTGRRASRYIPVWAKLDSVHKTPNATENEFSVRENQNTSVRETPNTTAASVRESPNEDPLTGPGDQTRGPERDIDCAAATPPPPAGPEGAAEAETAQDGFRELWNAYDYKRGKPEARRAYARLAPDADLHAKMVEAAREWQRSWEAQNKPDAPRFTLAKWIEREEYECEPPTAFKPKERKPKAVANDDKPSVASKGHFSASMRIIEAETIGSPFSDFRLRMKLDGPGGEQVHILKVLDSDGTAEDNVVFNKLQRAFGGDVDEWPGARVRLLIDGDRIADVITESRPGGNVEIAYAELTESGGKKIVTLWMVDAEGKPEGMSKFIIESGDEDEQRGGQKRFQELAAAAGLGGIHDTDELVGCRLKWLSSGGFERLPYTPDFSEAA